MVNNEDVDRLAQNRAMELTFLSLAKCFNINNQIRSIDDFFKVCDIYGMNIINEKLDENKIYRLMNYIFENSSELYQSHSRGMTDTFIKSLGERILAKRIMHQDLPRIGGIINSKYYLSFMRNFDAKAYGFHPATSKEYWNFNIVANDILESLLIDAKCISKDDVIVNSFQTNFQWLDSITIDDCLRLRSNDKIEDIRKIFKKETTLLTNAGIKDYKAIGNEFEKNIINLLREHYEESKNVMKKYRKNITKSSISFGASAVLGIASLASQAASILSLIFSLGYGGKSLLNILEDVRDLNDIQISNNSNPLTFLYNQYNENERK